MCNKSNQTFTHHMMIILFFYILLSLSYFYHHLKENFLVDVIIVLAFYHHLFNLNWHISKKLHGICNLLVLAFMCLILPFVPTLWLISNIIIEAQEKNTGCSGDWLYDVGIDDVITCGAQFNSFLQDSILGFPTSISCTAQFLISNIIKLNKLVYTDLVDILHLGYNNLLCICIDTIEATFYYIITGCFGLMSTFFSVICTLVHIIIIICSGLMSLFVTMAFGFTRELKPSFSGSFISFGIIYSLWITINLAYTGFISLFFGCVCIMKFIYPGLLLLAVSACFIS